MDNCNDVELGMRILPGIDLALWLRLVVIVLLAAAVGGVAVATI